MDRKNIEQSIKHTKQSIEQITEENIEQTTE